MTIVQPKQRILSIDIVRGIIMLIMALDHTREFFHIHGLDDDATNMATTTPILFFTRWITHFCAPNFLFLSGISAGIAGYRKTAKEHAVFLIKRGVWLLFVEVAIMTLAITFNPFYNIIFLQVIWVIGASMILLGLLLMLRTSVIAIFIIGLILFFGHNVFDYVTLPKEGAGSFILNMFIAAPRVIIPLNADHVIICIYTLLPWTGVLFVGYSIASLYKSSVNAGRRKRILLIAGSSLTILFFALRFINKYGDPFPWATQKTNALTLLSFFNTSKYPPSLQFLCMTIGPCMMLLSLIEQSKNRLTEVFMVYGRVPFFYYVLHFYLIHTVCVILFFASGYGVNDIVDKQVPFFFRPLHFGFSLPVVYLIWFFVVSVLYKPCKWFYKYKATHSQWWLRYI